MHSILFVLILYYILYITILHIHIIILIIELDDTNDTIRFGEIGWKDRYYFAKLKKEHTDRPFIRHITGVSVYIIYYERKRKEERIEERKKERVCERVCEPCMMRLSVVVQEYVKGLCWVLEYYFRGCPDWSLYYPFHYAPFASDFSKISKCVERGVR